MCRVSYKNLSICINNINDSDHIDNYYENQLNIKKNKYRYKLHIILFELNCISVLFKNKIATCYNSHDNDSDDDRNDDVDDCDYIMIIMIMMIMMMMVITVKIIIK